MLTVAVAGLALAVGFFGEKFFRLPPSVALGCYFLAYLAGALRLLAWHELVIFSRIGIPKTGGQE